MLAIALKRPVYALAIVVALFKLPILGVGFGSDPDAWRAFESSARLAATGVYIPSRLPGYPLPEYFGAVLVALGVTTAVVFNLVTALLSAVCAVLIFKLAEPFGFWRALGAAVLFSVIPVVVIAGASNVDYLWGLAFFLGAARAVSTRRIILAGVLLGLAAASRPTYALGIVPLLAMILAMGDRGRRELVADALWLTVISGSLALAFFVPVLLRYGAGMLVAADRSVPWPILLGNMSVRTFGVVGSLAIAVVTVAWLRSLLTTMLGESERPLKVFFGTSTLLYAVLFLRLPLEAGYLIPCLPGLCVLLAATVPGRVLGWLCAAMFVSGFFLNIDRSSSPQAPWAMKISRTESLEFHLAGPILNDVHERKENFCIAKAGGAIAAGLNDDERLAVGGYLPIMKATLPPEILGKIVYGARKSSDGNFVVHETGERLPARTKFIDLDIAEHFLAIAFDMPVDRVASTASCR